jgi:hypothetical protein
MECSNTRIMRDRMVTVENGIRYQLLVKLDILNKNVLSTEEAV